MKALPRDYVDRVYAGVLGKTIGVYLGRPFEQWSHEAIVGRLGVIRHYVHDRLGVPLVVSDDDLGGTFSFVRALDEVGGDARRLTSRGVGETWLNLLIPGRTVLWWGGVGISTEHTAWHRLASGIPAPRSGSAALNGRTVAEQIGAQIFIDGWGLLCPGDPAEAVRLATLAARVSHDGTAVHAARVVAAMVALAFEGGSVDRLLEGALRTIPARCPLARMIADVRSWHAAEPDWRENLARIRKHHGYDVHPGDCHVIPNHALIVLALLHGAGDFARSMTIVNTAGYDTDCNSGNVGCILGVCGGLATFEGGPDWRGPVADRLLLPTADGGATVTDTVRITDQFVARARRMRGLPVEPPKGGSRFHFSRPGSVQGFQADPTGTPLGITGERGRLVLCLRRRGEARAWTPTFPTPESFAAAASGYSLVACPTLATGQRLEARVVAGADNRGDVTVRFVVAARGSDGSCVLLAGPDRAFAAGRAGALAWTAPDTGGRPIEAVGLEVNGRSGDCLELDRLGWRGAPRARLLPMGTDATALRAWVDACAGVRRSADVTVIHHGAGLGWLAQGTDDWDDYAVEAELTTRLAFTWGVGVRWQGLRRHLSVRFDGKRALLVACTSGRERILTEADFAWPREEHHVVTVEVRGRNAEVAIDGRRVLSTRAIPVDLATGGVALCVAEGQLECRRLDIAPLSPDSGTGRRSGGRWRGSRRRGS